MLYISRVSQKEGRHTHVYVFFVTDSVMIKKEVRVLEIFVIFWERYKLL